MPRGYRGGGRYGSNYGGRNQFQGYRGDGGGRGRGGRGNYGRGSQGRGNASSDQHQGISFMWNLATDHKYAKVMCMAFDEDTNHLYVGMDNGVVKIYLHNSQNCNNKQRFVPSEPAEVMYENCSIKSLMCYKASLFIAMVTDKGDPGSSRLYCPNSQQTIPVPGKIEAAALCTKAETQFPSIWASTTNATIAVVDVKPADDPSVGGPAGTFAMVPKAELNTDRAVHGCSITRTAEVFCGPANQSVLISGDMQGVLAVWRIDNGTALQQFNQGTGSAVTGILEYKGTHFLVSFFNGTVGIFQFEAQPAEGRIVSPQPVATYMPAAAGFNANPAAVLCFTVTYGPSADPQNRGELCDWLVVSRLDTDALEVVSMAPGFRWGGTLGQTRDCHSVLPVEVKGAQGADERFVVCGAGSIVKIFRWKN